MTEPTMAKFFAILSLVAWTGTVITIGLALARRRNPDSQAALLYEDVSRNAVWLAFVVALVTMLGSLYLSQIAHFVPCPLCWYQRICMYPLTLTLLVGALRRDRTVWTYVMPPALVGVAFAIYHTQLQAFPNQTSGFCTTTEPCTVRYVWEFGFISIPFMSLAAFAFILTMMFVMRADDRSDDGLDAFEPEDPKDDDAPSLSVRGAV